MGLRTVILVAACASTSTRPEAEGAEPEQVAATNDGAKDPSKRRCRTIRVTGSRVSERVCRTNAEWDRIERQSREAIGTVQQARRSAALAATRSRPQKKRTPEGARLSSIFPYSEKVSLANQYWPITS